MKCLLDTNVLLRMSEPGTVACDDALRMVAHLRRAGHELVIAPQVMVEFWCAATRPSNRNGLGWSVEQADAALTQWEASFGMVPETPAIYHEWRRLVGSIGVSGVQVHDARIVAGMTVHGITHILTFNVADFTRFAGIGVLDAASA